MTIKRHFFNKLDYELDYQSKTVRLLPDFYEKLKNKTLWDKFGFKKIGGSSIGDVLEVDQYKSPFVAFCRLSWLGLPILDRKYVDAGIAIEPLVIAAIEKSTNKKIQTFSPSEYNYDYFSDKDEVVGGLPDGYIAADNLVLEIKTTGEKNLSKWAKWGVPISYLKQAQLYAYLMSAPRYSIVATFLKDEDYSRPNEYPIANRKIKNWVFNVDTLIAEDDIAKVKKWYYHHTTLGASPKWDDKRDHDLLQWLSCENVEQWNDLERRWKSEGKIPN